MANLKQYVVQQLGRRFLHTMHILTDLALDCLVTIHFCHFLLIVLFGVWTAAHKSIQSLLCVLFLTHFTNVSGIPPGGPEEPGRHNLCPLKLKGRQGKPWRGITINRSWESCGRIENALVVDKRQGSSALEISEGYSEKMVFEPRPYGEFKINAPQHRGTHRGKTPPLPPQGSELGEKSRIEYRGLGDKEQSQECH